VKLLCLEDGRERNYTRGKNLWRNALDFTGQDADASDDAALASRAAWLHYVEGLTQIEVAKQLGLAPLKAHRLIARAVRDGLIRVFVEGPIGACIELERGLRQCFGLASCRVVPTGSEAGLPLRALGRAAAGFLHGTLDRGEHRVIGVGHGRTLAAMVSELPRCPAKGVRFISLLGSLPRVMAANPYDVIYHLADKTSADADLIPVPFLANTPEDRAVLLRQEGVAETLAAAGTATLFLIGIGEVGGRAFLPSSSAIVAREVAGLQQAGAVGEVLGHYFDRDGRPVETPLRDKVIGLAPEVIRGRQAIAVAGGSDKAPAIQSVLRSGLLSGLITDEATARRLVGMSTRRANTRGRPMHNKFKTTALAAVVTLASTLAVNGAAQAEKPIKIGMTFQELNNPYFVTMQKALKEAAASIGAQVVVTDAHHDVSKQISDVEDMLQQGINILLVNPTDTVGITSAVNAAVKAGVVVVAVDANANGPVASFVGSKNYDGGLMACDYLAKAIGGKGDVAILDGIPVVPILERVRGCKAALAKYPDVKLVDTQNGKQERATALAVTENMISAHPNLKGLFSVNDGGSMGALSAIDASGKDIKLTSVDGAPEAIAAIEKPGSKFIETSAQFPADMVRIGLGIGLAKYWGANVPSTIPIDVKQIDQSNAKGFHW